MHMFPNHLAQVTVFNNSVFVWGQICSTNVYLQQMRVVDSKLARTLEDLSDFGYIVKYMPGDKKKIADLMSRMPDSERLEGSYALNMEYWPKGLMNGKESKGGGDSMFESMLYDLHDLMN